MPALQGIGRGAGGDGRRGPAGPARSAPSQPLIDPKTQQTIQTIVGAILFFGLMAWMKGCKDDLAKERANPPPIIDRNKNR